MLLITYLCYNLNGGYMKDYLNVFIDQEYPVFIDKYLKTKTMRRIKYITQFCGCDYTKLYNPLFLFTRLDHSLVVAHMVWHFTHDKKSTIVALLHDVGTPCFAHTIDVVMGDSLNQESSERDVADIIKQDSKLLSLLKSDGIDLGDFKNMKDHPILENKSPNLCADRLDGVLHTCYIWVHTHSLEEIKEVYDDLCVLNNESNSLEIGFRSERIAVKFANMVSVYSKELQGNRDKYVMKYICEVIKKAFEKDLISLDDLYDKKEKDIVNILKNNYESWKYFSKAKSIISSDEIPDQFYISFDIKKRKTIPLVLKDGNPIRINKVSSKANQIYLDIDNYHDKKYGYLKDINKL